MSDALSMLAADPAATTTTAADPAVTAATTTATTTTAAPAVTATWLDGLDDDSKKFIETKGYKTAADALAELRASAPPDSPDKYDIPVPQGEDPTFSKAVAPLMHKAGLSAAQAKSLAEGWNELGAAQRAAAAQAAEQAEREQVASIERQKVELKGEWGSDFDKNSEHVRRAWTAAASAAGVPADKMQDGVEAMCSAIGHKAALKMFAMFGGHFAEDTAHGLAGKGSNTVVQAAARLYDKSNMNP